MRAAAASDLLGPLVVVVVVLGGDGCPRDKAPAADPEAPTQANDGISPVYPTAPADPRALAVCEAVHGLPAQRKAACCSSATGANTIVQACVETLSGALATGDVTLQGADACVAKRSEQLAGCAWVGAVVPPVPSECASILVGDSGEGARCRSSLECAQGLRCLGSSPLDAGRCGKPAPPGGRCGAAVDALAIVIGQPNVDARHPECISGSCALGRCQTTKAVGEPCALHHECGAGNRCDVASARCVAGRIPLGGGCSRSGCADDAFCLDGACAKLRGAGEACRSDFDCARGGCASGACGMRCLGWKDFQTRPAP